ncbi:hypothetical protein HIM_12191 [Hirsutella minnesotensis 3608]|uniref:Protein argonaute N-terminal domain-containing protein n=1 Tax=Hirsutella minnesotensis 3608 TaxID=1043627 RepID=A0A0F8A0C5_9HYPO|nr:hypothetical protein HIM_12191 [Hirsutella minnesotensis 3608]
MSDPGGRGGRGRGGRGRGYGGGDRGRGGYRGDAGGRGAGFRGRRGGGRPRDTTTELVFSVNGSFPAPDPAVQDLENLVVKAQATLAGGLAAQIAKVTIKGPAMEARSTDIFPIRPAFGSGGKPSVLYKYNVEFIQVGAEAEPDRPDQPGKPSKSSRPAGKEVKGRKLYMAMRELLSTLTAADQSLVLATEYKSQLISLQKLKLAEYPVKVRLPVESGVDKVEILEAAIHGPPRGGRGPLILT